MALLDRFRTRPGWEDPDTETRLQAVLQIPAADRELLASIARGDEAAPVRRAAVKKLQDPELLAALSRDDDDEAVREEAVQGLLQIARASEDEAGARALQALDQPRHLVVVAREGRSGELRRAALERLEDQRSLAAVAKAAVEPALRQAALERLADPEQLAEVAGKSSHKDVAVAAVERLADLEALRQIAAHARNKAAARRARARLEELTGAPQPVTPDEQRTRDLELCRRLEALEGLPDVAALEQELGAAREEWRRLASHDEELARRFEETARRHEQRVRREREEAAERRALEERGAASARARLALCERVEALEGEDIPGGLEAAVGEWEVLEPLESDALDTLARRFEAAEHAARDRHAAWLTSAEQRSRLEELCGELERRFEDPAAQGTRGLRSEARALAALAGMDAVLASRHERIEVRFAGRDAEARAEQQHQQQQNRERIEALTRRIESLASEETPALGPAREALRESRTALESPGSLPGSLREVLLLRLRNARGALYPKVQELQDEDEWRRFGNAAVQQELCEQVEALRGREDLENVARQLRDIRNRWKQAATAPREEAEALWERFKAARDEVQAKVDVFLQERGEELARNLEQKKLLCDKAEALQSSTDWSRTAEELKKLQAEWKQVGPVARKHSNAIWKRFRAACDHFFEARKNDLQKRKEDWSSNLAQKRELCEKAEAIQDSTDWEATAAAFKVLQGEWKQVGPVRRDRSEAVWKRFRAACDVFFERYRRRDQIAREQSRASFDALCAELEALLPGEASAEAPEALREKVEGVHQRWRAGSLPREARSALEARYQKLRRELVQRFPEAFRGSELDPEANRGRAERLIARVEKLAASAPAAASSQDLATRLREALAANTIGGGEKRRHNDDELQAVRAAWSRLGPLPGEAGRALEQRFHEACRRAGA